MISNATSSSPRIALLGCGTVGDAVAKQLLEREGAGDLRLTRILVRDVERDRGLPRDRFTNSFDAILEDEPDIIIEVLGGLEPARDYVERALTRGISVVTANKTLMAHHGPALEDRAANASASIACEAAVCAGVPIITACRQLAADRIRSMHAILNGSCNFILSEMERTGCNLSRALQDARARGLVEPDASADVSGRDAAEKLCILARRLGFEEVRFDEIDVAGIESITPDDLRAAKRAGGVLRLVAELRVDAEGRVRLSVGPAILCRDHPLARLRGAENGVTIDSHERGRVCLTGPGAGPAPTAAAILADVRQVAGVRTRRNTIRSDPANQSPIEKRPYALRIRTRDARLDRIIATLRDEQLDYRHLELRGGVARILTKHVESSRLRAFAHRCAQVESVPLIG